MTLLDLLGYDEDFKIHAFTWHDEIVEHLNLANALSSMEQYLECSLASDFNYPVTADNLYRLALCVAKTKQVFKSDNATLDWLKKHNAVFNSPPIMAAATYPGTKLLLEELVKVQAKKKDDLEVVQEESYDDIDEYMDEDGAPP